MKVDKIAYYYDGKPYSKESTQDGTVNFYEQNKKRHKQRRHQILSVMSVGFGVFLMLLVILLLVWF